MSEEFSFGPEMFEVDGEVPKEVWKIGTEKELVEALRTANSNSLAVIPLGSGTKRHIGFPPIRYDVALLLRSFQDIVEYSPDDLVIVVGAGMSLAELQQVLARRNQFLPIDPPFPEKATVGGIVSSAMAGPSRCLYGAVREHLLGVKVAQPEGTITRFGGKVVKNAAGYDLTKLYVGSFGTLGVIVEAAFKVRPLPERRKTLPLWSDRLETMEEFLTRLVLTDIAPAFAELLNEVMLEWSGLFELLPREATYCLLLGFDGFEEEVDWCLTQSRKIAEELELKVGKALQGEEEEGMRAKIRDAHAGTNATLVLKALLPSSEICSFTQFAQDNFGNGVGIIAHSLNGIVRVMAKQSVDTTSVETVQKMLNWIAQKGGNWVMEKVPVDWKLSLPIWGRAVPSWKLMRRLKETLDPLDILSPGRMFRDEINQGKWRRER